MSSRRRIFVAWDSQIPDLEGRLEVLAQDPNRVRQDDEPELEITVPMLEGAGGEIWNDNVAEAIERSDGVLAYLDLPNANVAFEVGYALGLGKAVWLVHHGVGLPRWVAEPPFQNQLLRRVESAARARELLRGRHGDPLRVGGVPPVAGRTLVLCPGGSLGSDARECLPGGEGDRARLLDLSGCSFRRLSDRLAGAERAFWIVLSYAPGEDVRDGAQNAALAAVAGFLHAHERELWVLRQQGFRRIADVDLETREWSRPAEIPGLIEELLPAVDAPVVHVADALATWRGHLRRWNEHALPRFGAGATRTLGDIYVSRHLGREVERDAPALGEAEERGAGEARLEDLIDEHAARNDGAGGLWLVLGTPGSGKTTLLRRMCAQLSEDEDGPVPVLISLAHLSSTRAAPFDLAERDLAGHAPGLAGELARLAQEGRVWLLLDGLDEVRGRDLLELPGLLAGFHQLFRRCPIVVTSRDEGRSDLGLDFVPLRLLDLGSKQVESLLESWLPGRGAAVLREIRSQPQLSALSHNPWMLTLMAELAEEDQGLPRRRSQLFERSVALLLKHGTDPASRGVRDPDAALELLPPLALRLQREGGESWTRRALARHLRRCCLDEEYRADLVSWGLSAAEFLGDLGDHSGLLAPRRGPNQPWEFAHRSLREFLVARAWAEAEVPEGEEPEYFELLRELAELDTEDDERAEEAFAHWGETLVLLAGRLEDPERCKELVNGLSGAPGDLRLRALADVTALTREEALAFLMETRGWDGDDLLLLLRGWLAGGAGPDEVLAVVRPCVPGLDVEGAGRVLYAVESAQLGWPVAEFFEAWGRPQRAAEELGIEMKAIPAGEFEMGSPPTEAGRYEDEDPLHGVEVAAFDLASCPVTVSQFAPLPGGSVRGGPRLPATGVSWYAARLFCRWIGGRLPTEAEWEYACRAGSRTAYWSGDAEEDLERVGWYHRNSDGRTHPVGEKPANAFGLHDVHGNVWEWVQDRWSGSYEESASVHPGAFEPEEAGGRVRVLRGGAFDVAAGFARSAYRYDGHPDDRYAYLGFRPARASRPATVTPSRLPPSASEARHPRSG